MALFWYVWRTNNAYNEINNTTPYARPPFVYRLVTFFIYLLKFVFEYRRTQPILEVLTKANLIE